MTIPVGSTNVPVTSVTGIEVGQKIALGYGATYPAVAKAMEKYEVVTVTAVGKPGTQAWLSADAKAGDTNIKVSSVANISVGDKIRLDIDSVGHGIETVTVKSVGTQSARNSFNGPLRDTELGTGLDLAAPLSSTTQPTCRSAIAERESRFTPATAVAHSSNEPVLPLGAGITLDQPWPATTRSMRWCATRRSRPPVIRERPRRISGSAARHSPMRGTMVLRDAAGLVVDSLNYGILVDPWAAEGYHGVSGTRA